MKHLVLSMSFGFLFFINAFGQVPNANQNLLAQANKMTTAFIEGDYKSFAKYNLPQVLKMIGGPNKFEEIVAKSIDDMKAIGLNFIGASFGAIGTMYKSKKDLQTTLPQQLIIKTKDGKLSSGTTLICISLDNGVNWKFMDSNGQSLSQIKAIVPNINSKIKIPAKQAPVKID